MIRNKHQVLRVQIHEVDRFYTSKCKALDLEPIQKHKNYIGIGINRGSSQGLNYCHNADVNGTLNFLRKVVGDGFIQDLSDRGCWFQPVRIRDVFQTSHEQFLLKSVNNI